MIEPFNLYSLYYHIFFDYYKHFIFYIFIFKSNIKDNCYYDKSKTITYVTGYVALPPEDERALTFAIANIGPIASAIDVSSGDYQFYKEGVFYSENCFAPPDLSVLITGFGTSDDGKDFYAVRFPFGPNFGDKGYVLMSRNRENNCGIASYAFYPILDGF